ncbi:thioredoxin family protein [Thalassotalea sp. 1_MG-2023]|uniref:thioredoxin family protein n=1 Tax=Thalassotalea sp. 1_MG-2023 TaxID=3062680 RepID=UPI0026E3840C|nr:thioredoxin family protein [Thalassotalea sp. 1_MG-2023]MDO6426092.1 thioredoxin family protein [Thalassotalea sp. 1_MG-2023]
MLQVILITLGSSLAIHPVLAQEKINLPAYSQAYDESRNPFDDARAAIVLASKTQRNILIEIGGNWCVWCQKMEVFLTKNPDVNNALHQAFVLLKINVSEHNDNHDFLKSLPPVVGYPHIFVSTNTGKVMLSKETGEFIDENGEHSRNAWLMFIEKWQMSQNSENLTRISAE